MTQKHGHYYKDITNLQKLDIYRIIDLYDVRDGAIQHAIKKLLLAGGRGVKDMRTDIQEAIDSLNRKLEMLNEDEGIFENVQSRTIVGYDSTTRYVKIQDFEADKQDEISFAELDDLSYNKGTMNWSTQPLNPKNTTFKEVSDFMKKYPEESFQSAYKKVNLAKQLNSKYGLKVE